MDEPELDVVHPSPCATAIEIEKNGRIALRVHGAVDRVDDDAEVAAAERALAELLGDEGEVDAVGVQRLEPAQDGPLGRVVDDRRLVAALAGAEHALAIGAAGQLGEDATDVLGAPATELEPVRAHRGWNSRPVSSLG